LQVKASRSKYFAVSLALACACGSSAADLDRRLLLQDEAFLCELRGDWGCAAERYKASLQIHADDLPTQHRYARALASQGDYAGAARAIDRLERQIPGGAIAPLLRADLPANARTPEGLRLASLAVERAPDSAAAYLGRGNLRARRGDYVGALEDFQRVETLWPEYTPATIHRAIAVVLAYDDAGEALRLFTAAIENDQRRESLNGGRLYMPRAGGAFHAYFERARLRLLAGDPAGGCADLAAAVARGYVGDPLGCQILVEQITQQRTATL
jgi:tetratricopeptide (TPR) repeat protein